MNFDAALHAPALPHLSRRLRLQYESAQTRWVLRDPEGTVQLNDSAAEILRRCDGQRDVAAIIADLEQCFQQTGLANDVQTFLGHAGERGWLV